MTNPAVEYMAPRFHKALKDFGYGVDLPTITNIVEDLLAGKPKEEVRGPAVFRMFIEGWMKEAGAI